jgi:hypothetical protein
LLRALGPSPPLVDNIFAPPPSSAAGAAPRRAVAELEAQQEAQEVEITETLGGGPEEISFSKLDAPGPQDNVVGSVLSKASSASATPFSVSLKGLGIEKKSGGNRDDEDSDRFVSLTPEVTTKI